MKWRNSHQRLTNSAAIGTEQFTPDQMFFRLTNARGRWGRDTNVQNMHTACSMNVHSDGTVDMIRLEAGLDGWTDLGGKGAYDVRAGRF